MKHIACTSFSPKGYEVYGKKFLETFLEYWPIEIAVFYEGQKPGIRDSRVFYYDLLEDDEFTEFQSEYGYFHGKDYRLMATKFSPKVFAKTSPLRPKCDWWIWVDADVVTFKKIDERFFQETCPAGFTGSYLGRTTWHHSETGFVSYNLNLGGKEFLEDLRALYTTGAIFSHKEWHDAWLFDRVREQNENMWFRNLSYEIKENHPWGATVLGEYTRHQKGPELKLREYGEIA